MLDFFASFCCRLLTFFFKVNFFESFKNTIGVSNSLDPDHDRGFVGTDLDLNCLQGLSSADNKGRKNGGL